MQQQSLAAAGPLCTGIGLEVKTGPQNRSLVEARRSGDMATRVSIAVCLGIAASTLLSCGGIPSGSATLTSTPGLREPGTRSCQPASPLDQGGREVEGTSSSAALWGLLMPENGASLTTGELVKIVWRMTGRGPLRLHGIGPGGRGLYPLTGPDMHNGSNWNRPGDEWGTTFRFPVAGCWEIEARRDDQAGFISVFVQGTA
jgi:hypothetical protein